MKNLILVVMMCLSLFARAEESCECPKLGCDPCSFENGSVTFFASKCGPNNSKVKSCGTPTCLPIAAPTKECPVPPQADSGPRKPVVLKTSVKTESVTGANEKISAGQVKVIQGSVAIVTAEGERKVIAKDSEASISEKDTIEAGRDSTAVVNFDSGSKKLPGNKMHIHPNTVVKIEEHRNPEQPEARKTMINLLKGKLRNEVNQKYKGAGTSFYKVVTRGAVAGVRGTDFVIEHNEDNKLETRVETLEGSVRLASLDNSESREIVRGEGAAFTIERDSSFKDKDWNEFIKRGTMSPVYKLDGERLAKLDRDSRVDGSGKKRKQPGDSPICDKPRGMFNQCSYRCENNPSKATKCQIDQPNVACIRSRCNGNGKWAEETKLPNAAIHPDLCPATGASVKDCDY